MGKNALNFEEYYKKNKVVRTYDSQREGNKYRKKSRKDVADIYLKLLDKKEGDEIIELGCGSGYLTQFLGEVTAIDTSRGLLEIAKKKNLKAKLIEANIFNLLFKNNSFDKAVTHRVIGNFKEKEYKIALKEIKRILKNDSVFIFDIGDSRWFWYWFRRIISRVYRKIYKTTGFGIHNDYYSLRKIRNMLGREGFKIEKIVYIKHRIGKGAIIKARLSK